MKKYRVTEKHEFYKPGCEFVQKSSTEIEFIVSGWVTIESEVRVDLWLKQGWIKEIQLPEFTKADMINFADFYNEAYTSNTMSYVNISFDEWIEKNK